MLEYSGNGYLVVEVHDDLELAPHFPHALTEAEAALAGRPPLQNSGDSQDESKESEKGAVEAGHRTSGPPDRVRQAASTAVIAFRVQKQEGPVKRLKAAAPGRRRDRLGSGGGRLSPDPPGPAPDRRHTAGAGARGPGRDHSRSLGHPPHLRGPRRRRLLRPRLRHCTGPPVPDGPHPTCGPGPPLRDLRRAHAQGRSPVPHHGFRRSGPQDGKPRRARGSRSLSTPTAAG